jgi:hypothetical protein
MCGELNRYFIELQPADGMAVPRHRETESRRALAAQFLETVGGWLREHALIDKVSTMAITALGQVQITCEADVINHIRNDEELNIATIRQSSMLVESASSNRWNEAR